jgi:hypothetical protein
VKQTAGRLSGDEEGKEEQRRWYFAHHPEFQRLREHHRQRAEQEKRQRNAWKDVRSARTRNAAREREYRIAMREYEEKRIAREEDKARWRALRDEILNHGAVKASTVTEDYKDLPVSIRSRNKNAMAIDNAAEALGFDYIDDYVKFVSDVQRRAAQAEKEKPPRPKRPTFEAEPRRVFVRHQEPRIRAMLNEYRESKAMLAEGERELGKNHPALAELRDVVREQRREYVDAARAAGERPAAA